jgi:hypothetical protein
MKERERGHPLQYRPVATMAGTHGSPESFGSTIFDHHSTHSQHQSVEELNANASTQIRKARTKEMLRLKMVQTYKGLSMTEPMTERGTRFTFL